MRRASTLRGPAATPALSTVAVSLVVAGVFSWHPPFARATEPPGAHALLFGVGAQQRSFESVSVNDSRPRTYGEFAGRADVSYLITDRWAFALSLRAGGSWFDFNGFGTSGRIVDSSWGLRAGFDRVFPWGERQWVLVGLGLEYGESRSWLDTFAASSEGPHVYMTGGTARVALVRQLGSRYQLFGDLDQSAYRAHAKEPSTLRTSYNWLGRSLAGSVGIRWVVLRGRRL